MQSTFGTECLRNGGNMGELMQQYIDEAEQDLRDLMNIPDNYKVMFIQGGATLQFAMIPMNLMKNGVACYVETGAWSKKAINEGLQVDMDQAIVIEEKLFGDCFETEDQKYGMAFFLDKNKEKVKEPFKNC